MLFDDEKDCFADQWVCFCSWEDEIAVAVEAHVYDGDELGYVI